MAQRFRGIFDETNMLSMESFGAIIQKLRQRRQLPLEEVAAFLNISQTELCEIEGGKRHPTREQVIKLAGYFKVQESDLKMGRLGDKLNDVVEGENFAHSLCRLQRKVYTIVQSQSPKKSVSSTP